MDIHYFLCNKTGYLAVFIKYTFPEKKRKFNNILKFYQGNIGPKRIENNMKYNANFYRW